MRDTLELLGGFLDVTLTYVLSREWQDLLSTYVLHLHPLPHCTTNTVGYSIFGLSFNRRVVEIGPECSVEASAVTQAYYALCTLLAAALLQGISLRCCTGSHTSGQITSIIGMCVGWGAGDSVVKFLAELQAAQSTRDLPPDTKAIVEAVVGAAHEAPQLQAHETAHETAHKHLAHDAQEHHWLLADC